MKLKHMIFYEADGVGGGGEPPVPPAGGEPPVPPAPPAGGEPPVPPAPPASVFDGPQVPEKYTFNLGEGLTISEEQQTALTDIARKANMTQETVDALLQMHSDIMLNTIRQAEEQRNKWAEECKAQGLATKENIGYARKCIEVFGGDAAMQALVQTGAANHPAVQKMLQNIGALLTEDNGAGGGGTPPAKVLSDADLMFPNSKYNNEVK